MLLGFIWDCCEEKKNKGKELEKKNNVVEVMRSWTLKRVKNRERMGDEKGVTVWLCETKRGWATKRKDLPIENQNEEDVVFHVVLSLKENFYQDKVVKVKKKSSTSVFLPKNKSIFKLSKKKLIFRSSKIWTMKN